MATPRAASRAPTPSSSSSTSSPPRSPRRRYDGGGDAGGRPRRRGRRRFPPDFRSRTLGSVNDDEAVAALADAVRRDLYRFVVGQGRPVGRGEAAEAVGVQRTLAAFHLDKLVDAGLLETGFQRLTERTGPGSGRPAKVYRRAKGERHLSLPPRDYRLVASLRAWGGARA